MRLLKWGCVIFNGLEVYVTYQGKEDFFAQIVLKYQKVVKNLGIWINFFLECNKMFGNSVNY